MLELFGLLGALLAGLAVDSFIGNMTDKADASDDDAAPEAAGNSDATGTGANILDWLAAEGDKDGDAYDADRIGHAHPDPVPASSDTVQDQDAELILQGQDADEILSGQGGDDTLIGGAGDDQLMGRGGDDAVLGGEGDDLAHGGAGADTLQGGAGNDLLAGEDGDDKLVGGAGADTLLGHEGADSLFGGAGSDTLIGGNGNDGLIGGDGDDWLAGGLGDDSLTGDLGSDTLDGGAGNDVLDGRNVQGAIPEMDFMNGGDGDDTLMLSAGDYATGGGGSDWFELSDLSPGDEIANIADYNADEDTLVVVFDPMLHPDPQLSIETPENTDDAIVLLDGVPLAMVQGGAGMSLDDVLLTPAQAA